MATTAPRPVSRNCAAATGGAAAARGWPPPVPALLALATVAARTALRGGSPSFVRVLADERADDGQVGWDILAFHRAFRTCLTGTP
jgi:hypothetical protein